MLSLLTEEVGFHTIQGVAGLLTTTGNGLLLCCEDVEKLDKKYLQPLFCKAPRHQDDYDQFYEGHHLKELALLEMFDKCPTNFEPNVRVL